MKTIRVRSLCGMGVLVVGASFVACTAVEEPADETSSDVGTSIALVSGQRGDNNKPNKHKPGKHHCGGHAGRGGGMAGRGGGGPGGSGGSPVPPACTGFPPATPMLTGTPATVAIPSSSYTYAAAGLVAPTITPLYGPDGVWQSVTITAAPGATTDPANNWLGVGVPFAGCVDASAYTGVRFTVTGDLGTCALSFVAVPNEKNADEFGGSCTEDNCFSPASAPFGVGTATVRFADLVGGSPDGPVNPARLMDIQWQLNVSTDGVTASCAASFTVSDIAFVAD